MEEWSHWHPVKNLSGRYSIDSLIMSEDGLSIHLLANDNNMRFKILFDGSIDSYRCINKRLYFTVFSDLSKKYGEGFYSNWSFFKIENSEYVQFLSTKSAGLASEISFEHFCIIGNDEVVDVLARYQPEIQIITECR